MSSREPAKSVPPTPSAPPAAEKPPPAYPAGSDIDSDLVSLGRIAAGAHADVYVVWSRARWCVLVMKELRAEFLDVPRRRAGMLAEGKFLVRLRHPNIGQAYEATAGPPPRILMELLNGPTLRKKVASDGPLAPQEAIKTILYVGSALMYLHRHGRLHLDVKPMNVVCTPGMPKLIDIGISRSLPAMALRPRRGGTVRFAAPEQTKTHLGPQTPATDVFGLAATLYFALTGEPPFPSHETFDQEDLPQLRGPEVDLRDLAPRASRTLAKVVHRALAPRPMDRFPDMPAFLTALSLCSSPRHRVWPDGLKPGAATTGQQRNGNLAR